MGGGDTFGGAGAGEEKACGVRVVDIVCRPKAVAAAAAAAASSSSSSSSSSKQT